MEEVTAEDYVVLEQACRALDAIGIPYVVGGGTAVALFGRNRRTKDFDLFLNREILRPSMDVLSQAGFTTTDTEKKWLYKAWMGDKLVDLIVESRGGIRIDDEVMLRSRMVEQHGVTFRVMSPEDVIFRKALTLTEGRPDWYDAISIIDRQQGQLDWTYILYRAQRFPRRVLACLLFAQTELHAPPGCPLSQSDNFLFAGDAPGPVPQWVIFALIHQTWLKGGASPQNPYQLEYVKKAA